MKLLKKLETDFKQINLNAPSLLYPKGKEKNLMLKLLTIFFFFCDLFAPLPKCTCIKTY
jgi:hypothetical protein